jgi:hypothetical protein
VETLASEKIHFEATTGELRLEEMKNESIYQSIYYWSNNRKTA